MRHGWRRAQTVLPAEVECRQLYGRNKVSPASISPCRLLYITPSLANWRGVRCRWRERRGGWGWGALRFHPMRLLLTGSSCFEKSPLWSFGPQGGCTTSMGEHSFGCRRHRKRESGRKERGGESGRVRQGERERQTASRDLDSAFGDSKA